MAADYVWFGCESCGEMSGRPLKSSHVTSPPPVLCIKLNYFDQSGCILSHAVHPDEEILVDHTKYILQSVVFHAGDDALGHYWAIVRHEVQLVQSWWLYNDTVRKSVDGPCSKGGVFCEGRLYMLFYARDETPSTSVAASSGSAGRPSPMATDSGDTGAAQEQRLTPRARESGDTCAGSEGKVVNSFKTVQSTVENPMQEILDSSLCVGSRSSADRASDGHVAASAVDLVYVDIASQLLGSEEMEVPSQNKRHCSELGFAGLSGTAQMSDIDADGARALTGQSSPLTFSGLAGTAQMSDIDTESTTATGTAQTALTVDLMSQFFSHEDSQSSEKPLEVHVDLISQLLECNEAGAAMSGRERSGPGAGEETASEDSSSSEDEASDDEDVFKVCAMSISALPSSYHSCFLSRWQMAVV